MWNYDLLFWYWQLCSYAHLRSEPTLFNQHATQVSISCVLYIADGCTDSDHNNNSAACAGNNLLVTGVQKISYGRPDQ